MAREKDKEKKEDIFDKPKNWMDVLVGKRLINHLISGKKEESKKIDAYVYRGSIIILLLSHGIVV